MIKHTCSIYTFIISSLLILPSAVIAKDSSYVSLQIGGAIPNSKLTHVTIVDTVLIKKSPKNAVVFNINAGTQVFPNTYAELEFAYANHKFNSNYMEMDEFGNPASVSASFKTRIKTMSGFANLSYRFENLNIMVIPYITAGVGISSNKANNMTIARNSPTAGAVYSPAKTATQAAWQIGGGLLVPVSKSVAVNLSYKYRDLGKIKTSTQATISGISSNTDYPFLQGRIRTSNILLGMNISF